MSGADRAKQPKICVAAATYRRPLMLRGLLESLARLETPPSARLFVVIVDNDPERSGWQAVSDFAPSAPWPVVYEVETRRGIPTCRNRAMAIALDRGADLVAFVDDDETVERSWLNELVRAQQERDLQLVGGPVRPYADVAASWWQRTILQGVTARYARKEKAAAQRVRIGQDDRIVVVTNNWLIDANWLRATALRFDERLLLTGGTDALFFYEARAVGARSGWSPTAIVREIVPASRLSFRYQFARARDQVTNNFHRKHPRPGPLRRLRTVIVAAAKLLGGVAFILTLPITGGVGVVQSARLIGGAWGLIRALRGLSSMAYQTTDGY